MVGGEVEATVAGVAVVDCRTGQTVDYHVLAQLAKLVSIQHEVHLAGAAGGVAFAELAVRYKVAADLALGLLEEVVVIAESALLGIAAYLAMGEHSRALEALSALLVVGIEAGRARL